MKLNRIDRMERIENILQEKIRHTEAEIESIAHLKDAEMARLRIMYLMDLGKMRDELIELRRRLDLEYAMNGRRRDDEAGRDAEGAGMGADDEADIERRMPEPDTGARAGRGVPNVGRDGFNLSGDYEGSQVWGYRRRVNGY